MDGQIGREVEAVGHDGEVDEAPKAKRKAFQSSEANKAASKALTERLLAAVLGEVVSYAELSRIAGKNVQRAGRGILLTAKNRTAAVAVWEAIPNRGLRRMLPKEVVEHRLPQRVKHIANTAAAGRAELATVDRDGLPEGSQAQYDAMATVLGGIGHMTAPATLKATRPAAGGPGGAGLCLQRVHRKMRGDHCRERGCTK